MSNTREFVIDERLLNSLVEDTDVTGGMAHKSIHHFLKELRNMGLAHRDLWSVRLFNGDSDADLDPDYAEHLDRLNSGLPSTWESPHEEEH